MHTLPTLWDSELREGPWHLDSQIQMTHLLTKPLNILLCHLFYRRTGCTHCAPAAPCMLATCHSTLARSRSTRCSPNVGTWSASSWGWIKTTRRLAGFALSSTIHGGDVCRCGREKQINSSQECCDKKKIPHRQWNPIPCCSKDWREQHDW